LISNSFDSTKLSWIKVDSIASLRDDLIIILKAFPADVVTGSSPQVHLDGELLSAAADSSRKMIVDIKGARSSFGFGETFTLTMVNGSSSFYPNPSGISP
jgi:hypothetical protein